ncbi:MAG: PIG-L family deacetylase, partial [Flavipsychrobacter sp.]
PSTSYQIYHEISQLNHLTNVLYMAAHPDDENTRLLAWLVNYKNYRTGYLSLTRGDGGQNILGSEQGEALGLIRTHELMEARKLDGAEQFFTRAVDFGFSKSYEETFKHWPEYLLTYDATWVMRKFRPDIIICRFPPNKQAGHGQHAASAIIAAKAFKASGNKLQYTEQLHTYPAWQPKRIVFNAYKFGSFSTVTDDMFQLKVGEYIPGLGMGVGELAGLSRSVHKSQGAGTPSVPGVQTEYFKLVDGDSLSESLFDGIDITWNRVDREDIGKDIQDVLEQFNFNHPDESLPALLAIRKKIQTVDDAYWRTEKLQELDKIILHCSGLLAELYTKPQQAVAGATLPFTLHVIARSHTPVRLKEIYWPGADSTLNIKINHDSLFTFEHTITIPASTPVTQPYWLAQPSTSPAYYAIPNDSLIGMPEAPNNLVATIKLKIEDQYFDVKVPLSSKRLDPVKGDVVEALRIVPDVVLDFTTSLLITDADGSVNTSVHIHSFKNMGDATLTIGGEKAFSKTILHIPLKEETDTIIPIKISKEESEKFGKDDYYLTAAVQASGKIYDKSQHLIQYNHIPTLQYFTVASTKVLRKNWKCTINRVGVIEGPGDYTVSFLRLAGLQVDVLKESDFTNAAKLKKYDAIITGIRAVNVEKRMAYWLPVLMRYVQNGGTLVMQYNTLQDLATTKVGPYPITLSTERVTEEDAQVKFLHPDNRVLNYPNKITEGDFNGWIQERGLYFASKWDDHYTPLFEMNDTGEKPLDGGTLYTHYGNGNYIYTS